jgi:hypothetical protein
LISSRNAFFYFICFFSSKVKFKFFYISLIIGLIGALFVLSFADTFTFLNAFSSKRFEGWNSIVLINELGGGGAIKADNFLVEIYLMVGWFEILAYLSWWIWIVIYQKGYNAIFYNHL